MAKKKKIKRKTMILTFVIIFFIISLVAGLFGLFTSGLKGFPCKSQDSVTSNCGEGLLCNIGSSSKGTCMTVEDCIASGSTADAFEGSEVCFEGV